MNWFVDYDQIARTFDKRYERNQYADVERELLEFVGSNLQRKILEVGCGTGHWLEVLRARGLQVSGLDFSSQMLSRARERLPVIDLNRGEAERLPWPAESFDRVFCINAIHHFVDKPAFLAEARRILRPGGMFLSVGLDPHSEMDQWFIYDYFNESFEIDKQRYPSSSSLRAWMQNAGFENCVTREVEHWIIRLPAQEIKKQGRLEKTSTSQLGVLTDSQYQQGIQRIREDIKHAEEEGQTLLLTADLRLYGTSGSIPE